MINLEQLTNDQRAGYEHLSSDDFAIEMGERNTLLTGAAGTGKTTLVTLLIQYYIDNAIPFKLTALTHKAAGVMREMLVDAGIQGVDVSTIHSALKLRIKENYKTGEVDLIQASDPDIPWNSILLVDEISMADGDLLKFIRKAISAYKLKAIYVGDRNQVPPVKQPKDENDLPGEKVLKESPVFDYDWTQEGYHKVELNETVRQPGNSPIVDLARNFIESHTLPMMDTVIENEHGRVELVDADRFLDMAKQLVTIGKELNDPKHTIVLAYTNAEVTRYNRILRAHAWNNAPQFQEGERLLVNEQVEGEMASGERVVVHNNETVEVDHATPGDRYGLDGMHVFLTDGRMVFAPNDTGLLIRARKEFARQKDWKGFYGLKRSVADLRPPYAVTVHKSQSSSYKHVLINMADIHSGNDPAMLQKLCYTAMTRASKTVVLTGYEVFWQGVDDPIYKKMWDDIEAIAEEKAQPKAMPSGLLDLSQFKG